MKLFNRIFKKRRDKKKEANNQMEQKLIRIGLIVIKELKSSRQLRRKLKGTRLNAIINQIINE